ncbi:FkbM family methyltransferase [Olleya sp. HaHaR_3_96]|uniref:FkbM family methyltransferase n=1 Tax=Olleya sp. HaHaR_3_96 TaxID=2745560 RepID=UPI001C4F7577|nr:FkbM family methyltransferase [Olleya sp. HaHaR_3_96]QXP61677.1 FkbM family methyltransferase [Olleya sp. HaHaR_3_96]
MIKKNIKKILGIYTENNLSNLNKTKAYFSTKEKQMLLKMPRYIEGKLKFKNLNFSFSDSIGFLHSFDEIFMEEVYKFESDKKSPLIIDCGSNVGLSILYFREKFPEAKIIGFEADNKIFNLLKNNISQFYNNDKIQIFEKAVWTKNTILTFFTEGSLAGSVNVDFSGNNATEKVQAVDFKKYLKEEIDFLKIDIEGAENELIFHIKEDLKNVKNLFLEYHGLIDKEQNLGDILNLLSDVGFEYYIRLAGETLKYPFCKETPKKFNQQLNIFCFRK